MDVREAISKAKEYVAEVFHDDGPRNIGLEEVRFDDTQKVWLITVGFSRPWDSPKLFVLGREVDLRRTYKIVRIDDNEGSIVSVTNRTVEMAEE